MSKASEQRRRAYEAGFRGDPAPEWVNADPELLAAFDRGLEDGDDPVAAAQSAGAGASAAAGGTSTATRARKAGTSKQAARAAAAPSDSQRRQADWERHTAAQRKRGQATPPGGAGQSQPLPSPADLPGARVAGRVTVDDGAGFLLGLLAFALGRAFLMGGSKGARAWLAAKFLNKPAASSWAGGTAGSSGGGDWGSSGVAPGADYPVNTGSTPAPTYPKVPWTPTTPTAPTPGSTSTTAPIPGNFVGGQQ